MAKPLRDTIDITDFDMYRPCIHCGSPECDPDQMELWVAHLVSCHGYKVIQDVPASRDGARPRTVTLNLVGWSETVRFKANERVIVRAGVLQRELVGRKGTVVGWDPSTAQFTVSFSERPNYSVMEAGDLIASPASS